MKVLETMAPNAAWPVGEIYMRPSPWQRRVPLRSASNPSLRTVGFLGDLGYFDADWLTVISPLRGSNVHRGWPQRLSRGSRSCAVRNPDCVVLVVGVPDNDLGSVPYAMVQPGDGVQLERGDRPENKKKKKKKKKTRRL